MLAFVDIQGQWLVEDPKAGPPHTKEAQERADNIAAAVGLPCQLVNYWNFSIDWMRKNGITGFFISGNTPDWVEYNWDDFKPLQEAIRSGDYPVMGFCGGHQFIGLTYGASCDAIGPLQAGEEDPMPQYHPGMRKEKGHYAMLPTVEDHPLFEGFAPPGPVLMQSHYWEIKDLPPEFELLASTKFSPIQVMRHRDLPIFGSQGHPEAYTAQHPDGKRLIRNFAKVTGLIED